jgi:large subunit ribosomal protein L17
MRHRLAGRTLGRRTNQRLALFRGQASSLIQEGAIVTTLAKAKELRRYVEPLITLAKRGDLHARRQAASKLYKKETVQKLFEELAPAFKERPGGYTRIYKLGPRQGDAAPMARIEFVGEPKKKAPKKKADGKSKTESKKAAPKKAAAKKTAGTKKTSKKSATKNTSNKKASATKKKATKKTTSKAK